MKTITRPRLEPATMKVIQTLTPRTAKEAQPLLITHVLQAMFRQGQPQEQMRHNLEAIAEALENTPQENHWCLLGRSIPVIIEQGHTSEQLGQTLREVTETLKKYRRKNKPIS